jgi:SulP family sulfate permease
VWPLFKTSVPPHLPAVVVGSLAAFLFNYVHLPVDTIATRFSYALADGTLVQGIPPILPGFEWPWHQPDANGQPAIFSWTMVRDLLPSAFAIAMLGAIESLLCAVVLDGMTGKRHSANSELLGQGIGNIVTPFFGGITATAAIARSAANFKAGAESPVAAMVHAGVVLLGLVALAPVLGYLPMPAMAALLVMVAWSMSEAPKSAHLLRTAHNSDRWVFISCFLLTIIFDMVIAITAGIVLAALLFMKEIADMTRVIDVTDNQHLMPHKVPDGWRVFKITGPLFFAAADKIFGELTLHCEKDKGIILYLDNVSMLDAGGVAALHKLITHCQNLGAQLILTDLQFQPLRTLAKAGVTPIDGVFRLYPTLDDACEALA